MAKRSLQSALARKEEPAPPPLELTPPVPAEKPRPPDTRVVTSLRMDPELMIGLKSLAVRERVRVNDVIVEAIRNHLVMKGQRAA
jgi:hypothetical protein